MGRILRIRKQFAIMADQAQRPTRLDINLSPDKWTAIYKLTGVANEPLPTHFSELLHDVVQSGLHETPVRLGETEEGPAGSAVYARLDASNVDGHTLLRDGTAALVSATRSLGTDALLYAGIAPSDNVRSELPLETALAGMQDVTPQVRDLVEEERMKPASDTPFADQLLEDIFGESSTKG